MKPTLVASLTLCALSSLIIAAAAQDAPVDLVKVGAKTYDTNCAPCHGDKLVSSGIAFDLKRLREDERPRFDNSVTNGKNAMPSWRGIIKEKDLDALWAYIRANAYP